MVPAAFVTLPALPLTPNGKVDRKALPAPERPSAEESYVAPRTPVEETLAGIWGEFLGVERIGIHDSFFALGGHSLQAVRLIARLREAFGVELPVQAVFEAPSVAALSAVLVPAVSAALAPEPVRRRARSDGRVPLSSAQEQLWLIERMTPGTAVFNLPAVLECRGSLDVDALSRALGEVVRRHEVLRARFVDAGGAPEQVVEPAGPPFVSPLAVADLTGLPAPEREAEAERRAADEAARPFDLAAGPLLRATLLRLSPESHRLLLTLHHIAADAWSIGVLTRELGDLYTAFAAGRPSPLPPLPEGYADFVAWQREQLADERLETLLAHWTEVLAGRPASLELPTDHPRPPVQSLRGGRVRVRAG
jgi:acyl carrier protein